MNEIQYVQRLGSDPEPPADDAVHSARLQLRAAIARDTAAAAAPAATPARARRRPFLRLTPVRLLAGVAAAGLLVAGIQAVQVTAPDGRGLVPASAADLLNKAARKVTEAKPLVAGPGQYRLVTTVFTGHGESFGLDSVDGADGKPLRWVSSSTTEVWVPADPAADLVRRDSASRDRAGSPADEKILRAQPFYNDSQAADVTTSENPNLAEDGPLRTDGGVNEADFSDRHMATLPRDPEKLLAYAYARTSASSHPRDEAAFDYLATWLRANVAPADLQAAFYQAAALLPSIEVVDRTATLDGRTGVAVALPGKDDTLPSASPSPTGRPTDVAASEATTRWELIFDPETGELIGERTTNDSPGFHSLIGGNVDSWRSYRVEVVDSAPKVAKR